MGLFYQKMDKFTFGLTKNIMIKITPNKPKILSILYTSLLDLTSPEDYKENGIFMVMKETETLAETGNSNQ